MFKKKHYAEDTNYTMFICTSLLCVFYRARVYQPLIKSHKPHNRPGGLDALLSVLSCTLRIPTTKSKISNQHCIFRPSPKTPTLLKSYLGKKVATKPGKRIPSQLAPGRMPPMYLPHPSKGAWLRCGRCTTLGMY